VIDSICLGVGIETVKRKPVASKRFETHRDDTARGRTRLATPDRAVAGFTSPGVQPLGVL
jgi:hypothetical protein